MELLVAIICFWAVGDPVWHDLHAAEGGQQQQQTEEGNQKELRTGGKYIRYSEKQGGLDAKLQTAITHFVRESDGARVDLIAVVHVGDQEYYDDLDNRMLRYDAVLYEMVGGPYDPAVEEAAPEEGSALAGLSMIHGMIQSLLDLDYQKDGIDYLRKNFIHADLDWAEFKVLSERRNQNLATLFQRAMDLDASEKLPGIPQNNEESQAMLSSLMLAVVNGDAATLKRILAPILSEAESLITQLEGADGTVLIGDRNQAAIGVLREQLRCGKRKLALLYGAGHMPDLEKRLVELGFHKGNTEWKTAWDIKENPSADKKNVLGDLLQNERLGSLLDAAMKLINQATLPAKVD